MTSIQGWTNVRAWAPLLAAALVLSPVAGCKSKMEELGEYPFYVKTLDKRWDVVRKSLASDKPDISLAFVIEWDLDLALRAMDSSYDGPNRDAGVARLKEILARYSADLNSKAALRSDQAVLHPGATVKDVADAVEKAYQEYLQFRAMVKVK